MILSRIFVFALLLVTFASCTTLHVYVDDRLKSNATECPVEGRQNAFKSQLKVGKFTFSEVKRGFTTSSSSNIFFKKQSEAKSKLSFKIKQSGMEVETNCAAQANAKGLIFGRLEITKDMTDVFSGMIQIKGKETWDFFVKNANNLNYSDPSNGYATNGAKRIEITDVRKAEGTTPKLMPNTIFGFSFSLNGELIGVVETLGGKGGAWIKNGLDAETELVVANLAAALLLRPDLSSVERR